MAGLIKKTTGLTGLNVSQHPHHVLAALYSKTLRALVKMPENAAYRIHTEKIIRERANIVSTSSTAEEIEVKVGCGQVEELIIQAENELTLSRKMLGWKPWEKLAEPAPPNQWDWPPAQFRLLPKQ